VSVAAATILVPHAASPAESTVDIVPEKAEDIARQVATDADREERRRDALSAYLDERVAAGYRIETRGGTQAIIAPTGVRSMLSRFDRSGGRGRQVVSVDDQCEVTVSPAEPLRS
jgi:hypothetical protein